MIRGRNCNYNIIVAMVTIIVFDHKNNICNSTTYIVTLINYIKHNSITLSLTSPRSMTLGCLRCCTHSSFFKEISSFYIETIDDGALHNCCSIILCYIIFIFEILKPTLKFSWKIINIYTMFIQ